MTRTNPGKRRSMTFSTNGQRTGFEHWHHPRRVTLAETALSNGPLGLESVTRTEVVYDLLAFITICRHIVKPCNDTLQNRTGRPPGSESRSYSGPANWTKSESRDNTFVKPRSAGSFGSRTRARRDRRQPHHRTSHSGGGDQARTARSRLSAVGTALSWAHDTITT